MDQPSSDDVINWSDEQSSLFVTSLPESRHASKEYETHARVASTEYAECYGAGINRSVAGTTTSPDTDKENRSPSISQSDSHPTSPTKDKTMLENSTVHAAMLKDISNVEKQMLPPSSKKRPLHESPSKPDMPPAKQTKDWHTSPTRPSPLRNLTNPLAADDSLLGLDDTNIDDTRFSAFSAVPDPTMFTRMPLNNHRPSSDISAATTPRQSRSPTRTQATPSLLIDFTQPLHPSSTHPPRLSPSRTVPNLLTHMNSQRSPANHRRESASPVKQSNLLNLLDFELPPPPTPRSAPAFSHRDVETLKATHQAQLQALKAKLSGREAEVDVLKTAVEDAERQASEARETAQAQTRRCDQAEQEKADWERRGQEVETLLKTVKEEVLRSEEEREALAERTAEIETKLEESEAVNLDLRAKLASIPTADGTDNAPSIVDGPQIQQLVQAQLDNKIDAISRELHSVYKKKHESKVAVLKKSYEARGEKRCAELRARLDELAKKNEELSTSLSTDATITPSTSRQNQVSDPSATVVKYEADVRNLNARLADQQSQMEMLRGRHAQTLLELEAERVEKGDLVAAVDEMLSLQAGDTSIIDDFRKSIARPSGMRIPGSASAARPVKSLLPESRAGSDKLKMPATTKRWHEGH